MQHELGYNFFAHWVNAHIVLGNLLQLREFNCGTNPCKIWYKVKQNQYYLGNM